MFLHLWLKHNVQAGSGFWKAFLFAAYSATYGQSLSKEAWSHLREKTQVVGFQGDVFFPDGRKLSINFMLYMLFSCDEVLTFMPYYCVPVYQLSRIHFPWSMLLPRYVWNSHCTDSLIWCFKTCTHWQVHWVFSITHCSVLHVYRQCHCSGCTVPFGWNFENTYAVLIAVDKIHCGQASLPSFGSVFLFILNSC